MHTVRGDDGAFLFDMHKARNGKANAAYLVAACNAVPELVARVRELERQREFFLSTLKENNLCPGKGRCWPDGSELEEWDCSATNSRECWIQASKEAGE